MGVVPKCYCGTQRGVGNVPEETDGNTRSCLGAERGGLKKALDAASKAQKRA